MIEPYNRGVTIVTPEYVQLQFRTAGLGSRSAAQLIDASLILAAHLVIFLSLAFLSSLTDSSWQDGLGDLMIAGLIISSFLLVFGYFAITEYFMSGQTFGKKWMGLRVVQENGQSLTFLSSIIRNFFRLIDFLPSFYFIGCIWMFLHSKDRRIGDLAAGTIVVMDVRREQMLLRNRSKKWMQKWQQDIPVLQLTDTERRRLERDDWLLLAAFIDRLPMLQKDKRYELSRQIAPRLAAKIQFADWEQFKSRPVAFLAGLYFLVEDDWSM